MLRTNPQHGKPAQEAVNPTEDSPAQIPNSTHPSKERSGNAAQQARFNIFEPHLWHASFEFGYVRHAFERTLSKTAPNWNSIRTTSSHRLRTRSAQRLAALRGSFLWPGFRERLCTRPFHLGSFCNHQESCRGSFTTWAACRGQLLVGSFQVCGLQDGSRRHLEAI